MNFLLAQAAAPAAFTVDNVTITLMTGMIVTVISAIAGGIVTVITALRMNQVAARQIENSAAITSVAKDTESIKGHVNSEKTAAEGRELALRKENEMLRQIVADKQATAALLAQAVASRQRGATAETVEKIETNTAQTAEGVKALKEPNG